jgi:hypothetical protein
LGWPAAGALPPGSPLTVVAGEPVPPAASAATPVEVGGALAGDRWVPVEQPTASAQASNGAAQRRRAGRFPVASGPRGPTMLEPGVTPTCLHDDGWPFGPISS